MKKEVANPSNIISYKRGCLLSIGLTQLCQFEYTAYNLFYILIGHSYWLSSKKQRYLEVKVRFLGCPPNIPNPRSAQLTCEWLDTTMGPSEQREFKFRVYIESIQNSLTRHVRSQVVLGEPKKQLQILRVKLNFEDYLFILVSYIYSFLRAKAINQTFYIRVSFLFLRQ